jgi:large subunit ribosomal protein LP2
MKHLAAYLLLGLAGNTSPSADDVKGVLSSVGVDADDDRLSKLLEELEGKDINEVRDGAVLNGEDTLTLYS